MGQPAVEDKRYFLGISGNQSGPYSENEVVKKIYSSQVPSDALIWFEGLGDWQPVLTVDAFRGAFEGSGPKAVPSPSPAIEEPAPVTSSATETTSPGFDVHAEEQALHAEEVVFEPEAEAAHEEHVVEAVEHIEPEPEELTPTPVGDPEPHEQPEAPAQDTRAFKQTWTDTKPVDPALLTNSSYATSELEMQPIFAAPVRDAAEEAAEARKKRLYMVGIAGIVVTAITGIYFLVLMLTSEGTGVSPVPQKSAKSPGGARISSDLLTDRQLQVNKALSEITSSADNSIKTMMDVIKTKSDDKPAEDAINGIVD